MTEIPQVLAAFAFFGAIFVCPLVYLLLKHQRAMAEIIHGKAAGEALHRLETVEKELRELKALQHEQVLRDDDQRELGARMQGF